MAGELPELPISGYREAFLVALHKGSLLLEAEPGAGKSTLTPIWALAVAPAGQAVWLVQPRVLAAQALARRLAELLGEPVGQTVGYQVPYDSRQGPSTRLLLMTPGILLQQLLHNPTLDGVATVMLDEIHERAVNQDIAWAWLQEVQILRDDLQLVLMSATPDPALQQQVSQRLFAPGRCFPVTTEHLPARITAGRTEPLSEHLLRALAAHSGWRTSTTLVFLPGWREIEDAASALQYQYPEHKVCRLHSRVPADEQARALDPAQGPRIILSTNIAETSLTIADVTLVIDSGLVRRPDFEQRTGISRLHTRRISQASADQRRGRAGRVQAGHCLRLWSQDLALAVADLPEIRTTDYLPLTLRLAHWGTLADDLCWIETPNLLAIQQAQSQLQRWGQLTDDGQITAAGRQVAELGTHPRWAALLQSHDTEIPRPLLLLALALHFDLPAEGSFDNWLQIAARESARHPHWQQQRKRWLRVLDARESTDKALDDQRIAQVLNDRIGYRQDSGRYRLNSGISVSPDHPLTSAWALFPQIAGRAKGQSGLGLPLTLDAATQRQLSQPDTTLVHRAGRWQQQTQWRMGGAIIAEELTPVPAYDLPAALCAEIARTGLQPKHWPEPARQLLQRARLAAEQGLLDLPDLSDQGLNNSLHHWLQPFLDSTSRLEQLPLLQGLQCHLGYEHLQQLHKLLPDNLTLPSGRQISVHYPSDGLPQISAKLQEFFGCKQLQLASGKIPLRIHLASPNGSPLAITSDLKSFWQQAYPQVRKEMRGRYPRHPWPEDPLTHIPTALTKRRLNQE